jgi:hypothetical protein
VDQQSFSCLSPDRRFSFRWKFQALAEYMPEVQTIHPLQPAISALLSCHYSFEVNKQIMEILKLNKAK